MIFTWLFGWLLAGQHAAADCCCASGIPATSHRPHIGCQFSVAGLNATPCRGVAAHALGLWWWTETKAQIRMLKYLLKGPGHGP